MSPRKVLVALMLLCGVARADGVLTPRGGTITGVTTGIGLTGGGTAGTVTVSMLACSSVGWVLAWNGSAWVCSNPQTLLNTVSGTMTPGDLEVATGPHTLGDYGGTGSVADKAITALSAAGVGTFQYFYDSPGTGLAVGATGNVVKLADTAVTPGTYALPGSLTIDQQGRITNAVAFAGSSPSACIAGSLTSQPTIGAAGALTNNCTTLTSAANSSGGGSSTTYLNGAGGWTTPPGTGVTGTGTTNTTVKYTNGAGGVIGNAWPTDDATTWGVASRFTITEANGNFRSFGTGTIDGAATLSSTATIATSLSVGQTSTAVGTLSVKSADAGTALAASAWDSKWTNFGPNVGNASGASSGAIGIGYSTTSDEGQITAAAPGSAWKQIRTSALSYVIEVGGNSATGLGIDSSGNLTVKNTFTANSTGSFGGALNMNSNKITSCANGTISSDGACFGQLATAVNAAVSGTSGRVAVFNGTNTITGYAGFTSDSSGDIGTANVTAAGNISLTQATDTYFLDSLASSSGNQNLNLYAAGTGLIRLNSNTGAVANAGTGGVALYAGANSSTIKWQVDGSGNQTNQGTAHIVGALTEDSSASIGTTLTQTAGNVTLNTGSGTTAITGHGATAGNVLESDATTGLAAANYIGTSISWSGTSHEGTGAGSAPCTNGFKCVKTLSVSNTGDVVTVSEGNSTSWIAIYADANNAHDTSIALYTDHGDVKLNQTSGSLLAHGAATFDSTVGVTGTLSGADATFSTTLGVTGAATLSGATTVKNDFFVATTGGTNKLKVLAATGHVNVMGTAIATGDLSGCGTTPAVTTGSTDVSGTITEGTTATGCTLTFKNTYTNVPFCVCEGETSGPAAVNVGCHATATTLVVENASASNDKFSYVCIGATGGT